MNRTASSSRPIGQEDLHYWGLLKVFRQQLDLAVPPGQRSPTWKDERRRLQMADYLSLFLFGLVNPIVATARALCQASEFARVRRDVCHQPVSLGSFSEAQHLIDPVWLEKLFTQLAAQVSGSPPKDPHQAWQQWFARDGSLLPALPRMHWALYGGGQPRKDGTPHRAVRLHLSFHLMDDKPAQMVVTHGKSCERRSWKAQWEKGAAYVGDRYYAEDYQCLRQLNELGCAYVVRLKDEAVVEVLQELPLSQADRDAGVTRQAWVRLGRRACDRIEGVRVVWVHSATAGELRLATNLSEEKAPAELISVIYRRRWQIEGFFKWLKCLLGCRHWLAESQNGVTVQLYLALIAAVLFQLFAGRRPGKRLLECIQLHLLGWVSEEELAAAIAREIKQTQQQAAKNPD